MRIVQYIKRVNNTELNKKGTKQAYIRVANGVNIYEIFPKTNEEEVFIFKQDCEKMYTLRLTNNGETRITGLGPFYRENDLNAGDKVLLEIIENENGQERYIDFKKYPNRITFQKKGKLGFDILTPNYQTLITPELNVVMPDEEKNDLKKDLKIVKVAEGGLRTDSPNSTPIYDILVGDTSLTKDRNIKDKEMIQLDVQDNRAMISIVNTWEKYTFEINE